MARRHFNQLLHQPLVWGMLYYESWRHKLWVITVDNIEKGQFLGICTRNAADGINGIKWVADRLNSNSAEKLEELEEFKEKLKIYIGENIEKLEEAIEAAPEVIEEKSGEITKKIEELVNTTIGNWNSTRLH